MHSDPRNESEAPPQPRVAETGFRRRGRIVYTLMAVLVFIGLAPLGTVAFKLISISRDYLNTSQQEYQRLLASAIAHEVDVHVQGLRSPVLHTAWELGAALPRASAIDEGEALRLLAAVRDSKTIAVRLSYFHNREVQPLDSGGVPDKLLPALAEAIREGTALVAQDRDGAAKRTWLSEPLHVTNGQTLILVSAPVLSSGRFRGVLSAVVDLTAVWDAVLGNYHTGHDVFAVAPNGRVIATTTPMGIGLGEKIDSAIVRQFFATSARGSGTMPFEFERNGIRKRYIGSYEATQERWGVFVQAPESDVYLAVADMTSHTLTWALAAFALAVVAAAFFAKTLSGPIKRFAVASRCFAAGDFSTRVRVSSSNEIGELAFTFNRMAEELEEKMRRIRRAAEDHKELFLGTIRALAQAIDAKDPYTRGHSVRVNRYSVILARELGLSKQEVQDIHVASLLHDVGKIGINDRILQKPGQLTDEEFEVMKTHPVLGANIMAPIRRMKAMLPGLRWHHERWGGGGYPDALKGPEIPLMARIIAVADAFDAMTTHRPYQTAMTFPQAQQRLNDLKTVAFEERIVEAFNRAYSKGLITPEDEAGSETAVIESEAAPV